jgi:putative oxidoreductase
MNENKKITATDIALLTLRIFVGIVFIAHGSQKLFGAFGGHGLAAMTQMMGPVLGVLVSVGEFFGGLGLALGVLPRFSAASISLIMLGAIQMVHLKNGFFAEHGGFEYPFSLLGGALTLAIAGPGQLSLSHVLTNLMPSRKGATQ